MAESTELVFISTFCKSCSSLWSVSSIYCCGASVETGTKIVLILHLVHLTRYILYFPKDSGCRENDNNIVVQWQCRSWVEVTACDVHLL